MEDILKLYKIPQFSYGSFETGASSNAFPPAFYCMVPNEALQYAGIVQLLLHFRWKWVGLMTMDDDAGEYFFQTLEAMLSQKGVCLAFREIVPKNMRLNRIADVLEDMMSHIPIVMESKVNAFVVYGETAVITWLATIIWVTTLVIPMTDLSYKGKVSAGKVWITTAQIDFMFNLFQKDWDIQMFHGSMSFSPHSNEPPGFQNFLQSVGRTWPKGNGFFKDFWEQAFDCSLVPTSSEPPEGNKRCTREEKLESLPGPFFEMSMTSHSYSIYTAVYAVTHALQALCSSHTNRRAREEEHRLECVNIEPWQVIRPL
uniref:Uncharacterized protein n=1 Tax=Sphaerodactylus townsendi TaxID=933632 RepID=A0ACB8EWZ4_9SAUR